MDQNNKLFHFKKRNDEVQVKSVFTYNSLFKTFLKEFFQNKVAVISLGIFLSIIISAIIIIQFAKDPLATDSSNILVSPNSTYWFGTDQYGRDMWSRTWWALLYSTILSLLVSFLNILIAVFVGVVCVYYKMVDWVFSWLMIIIYAIPSILFMILISMTMGASWSSVILSLTLTSWANPSQQIRANVLRIKNLDFITASKTLNASDYKIMLRFFVHSTPMIITQFAILFPQIILYEAMLGFLGLSIPDIPTLGNIISSGREYIISNPYITFIPTLFLIVFVGSFQFVAFGLEDAFGGRKKVKKFKPEKINLKRRKNE